MGIQRALIVQFVAGVPARTAAELVESAATPRSSISTRCREVIAAKVAEGTPFPAGEVAVDESCFGRVRKGKRGRARGLGEIVRPVCGWVRIPSTARFVQCWGFSDLF